jgi:hypothetical protein
MLGEKDALWNGCLLGVFVKLELGSVTVTRVNDDSDGFAGIRINERFIDV